MFRPMNIFRLLVLAFIGIVTTPLYAQLCKYVDESGKVTYSNVNSTPPKGAKKEKCFEIQTKTVSRPNPYTVNQAVPLENFPSVNEGTQKQRDYGRRAILQNELAQEQLQLAAAKRDLAEGEAVRLGDEKNYQKYLDRIQKLKDNVSQHEKNINALNQELANLGH